MPKIKQGKIIHTEEELRELAKKMWEIEEFAFDTETNTAQWVRADNDIFRFVGMSISWGDYDNYYIPTGHVFDGRQVSEKTLVKYLKPIFEREDVRIIGFNIKFDLHVLARIGIKPKTNDLFDVMVALWLCEENREVVGDSLEDNALYYLNAEMKSYNEIVGTVSNEEKKSMGMKASSKATMDMVRLDTASKYALDDSYYTWTLYQYAMELLLKEDAAEIYYREYAPYIRVLYEKESRGVALDEEKREQMDRDITQDMEDIEYRMFELAGAEFNPGSDKQMQELLFGYVKPPEKVDPATTTKKGKEVYAYYQQTKDEEKTNNKYLKTNFYIKNGELWRTFSYNKELVDVSFHLPIQSRTKTGSPQTNGTVLKALSRMTFKNERQNEGVELCRLAIEYSKLSKLHSSFISSMPELVYPDGKLHPDFNIIGTVTGRLSCIAKDTNIKLVGEDKAIQDVKVGDLAYCYDDDMKLRISPVTKVYRNGIKETVKITMRSMGQHDIVELVCTPDHEIRLAGGTWIRADELIAGDRVLALHENSKEKTPKKEVVSVESHKEVEVFDLEIKDYHNFIANEVNVHNCSSPNLQQLPTADDDDKYQIRSLFRGSVCPTTGRRYHIIAIDYDNLEMKVLTHFSKDKILLEMFEHGNDAHGTTAVNMLELDCHPNECKEKYPVEREIGKLLNFMLVYGAGEHAFFDTLLESGIDLGAPHYLEQYNQPDGISVAKHLIDLYFSTYEGVSQTLDDFKRQAKRYGYTETIIGRKRRYHHINDDNNWFLQGRNERQATNSPIQGTAGDICRAAQNRIFYNDYLKNELDCHMIIQVHDEIVMECPEENVEEATRIALEMMEDPFDGRITFNLPITASANSGINYQVAG